MSAPSDNTEAVNDLVYTTKVPSNRTRSGYEVVFDPEALKAGITVIIRSKKLELLERLTREIKALRGHDSDLTADMNRALDWVIAAIEAERERLIPAHGSPTRAPAGPDATT